MKREFTTREWVLLILIISIVQGFIWYISFVNSGNPTALNYVSFAGTLISIILAVLAIGYTYGESLGQKNKSETITNQIATLNEVIKNVQIQTSSLDKISTINDELQQISEDFKDGFNNTHKKVDDVKNSIHKMILENLSNPTTITKVPNNIDKITLSKLLISARSPLLEITILFIYSQINEKFSGQKISQYINQAKEEADEKKIKYKDYGDLKQLFIGTSLAVNSILQGLELIDNKSDKMEMAKELVDVIEESVIPNLMSTSDFYALLRDQIINSKK